MNEQNYFAKIGLWPQDEKHVVQAYVAGFILSLIITLAAYALVVRHMLPHAQLAGAIAGLAILQFIVQLTGFLHLSAKRSERERLLILACASVIVLILFTGSLWIMFNLNQRMMMNPTQHNMEQYMRNQGGGF